MTLYVYGSIAYDRIMRFPGLFSDSILPDKIHTMNVSFAVERLDEKLGGCAGNIAYSLAVLGEKPVIVSRVGRDFARYQERLEALGLSLEGISRTEEELTPGAYIITDQSNNQITAFNPGASRYPASYAFEKAGPGDMVIVSPGNLENMREIPRICREKGVRYIYDPGQQLAVLTGEDLIGSINGSYMLTCNDYEFELICQRTGKTPDDILAMTENSIVTLGENGSRVHSGGRTELVPPVAPKRVADPTGAGDAYRAGLLKGLSLGFSVLESARLGATAASFCVESYDTQAAFTAAECKERHRSAFGVNL